MVDVFFVFITVVYTCVSEPIRCDVRKRIHHPSSLQGGGVKSLAPCHHGLYVGPLYRWGASGPPAPWSVYWTPLQVGCIRYPTPCSVCWTPLQTGDCQVPPPPGVYVGPLYRLGASGPMPLVCMLDPLQAGGIRFPHPLVCMLDPSTGQRCQVPPPPGLCWTPLQIPLPPGLYVRPLCGGVRSLAPWSVC